MDVKERAFTANSPTRFLAGLSHFDKTLMNFDMTTSTPQNRCNVLAASVCLLVSMANSVAQGTILFDTMEVGARVYDSECKPLTGDGFVAQLYVMPEATGTLIPVGVPVPFGDGDAAGYVQGGTVVVPFIPSFGSAYVTMLFWESRFPSYEEALDSGFSMVGRTSLYWVFLGTEEYPAELFGMETLWGGCEREVRVLEIQIHDETLEMRWSKRGLQSMYIVVPQEADSPVGPWCDIDGPWNPVNGIASPPSSFHIAKPESVKFYRMRVTSNIGGLNPCRSNQRLAEFGDERSNQDPQ